MAFFHKLSEFMHDLQKIRNRLRGIESAGSEKRLINVVLTCGLRSSVCCLINCIFSIQLRIFPSSWGDNIEHIVLVLEELEDGIFADDGFVVDVTLLEEGTQPPADVATFLVFTSPSARTQERFIPAFSQAWNRQNWQFLRVLSVIWHLPPLVHL